MSAPDSPRLDVVHLIPYDGIGGVEVAARSLPAGDHGGVRLGKLFIARSDQAEPPRADVWTGPSASEWSARNWLGALRWLHRRRPRVLVVSLWRSCLVALAHKALSPRTRLVAFLHLAEAVHLPDRLLNRLVMALATEIWADSEGTLAARVPARLRGRGRVIAFLTDRLEPAATVDAPRLLFWGRLHPQKGLGRALEITAALRRLRPDTELTLIGPDGGDEAALRARAGRPDLAGAVRFRGPMARDVIFEAAAGGCFYLQPSLTEGMAMSVVEAMQLGLVPVVTPVGEIARYARDGENAVVLPPDEAPAVTAARLDALLADPEALARLRAGARETWRGRPLYRDDILAACRAVLA